MLFHARGNVDRAEEFYRKSLEMSEELGNPTGVARALTGLGNTAHIQGQNDVANLGDSAPEEPEEGQ